MKLETFQKQLHLITTAAAATATTTTTTKTKQSWLIKVHSVANESPTKYRPLLLDIPYLVCYIVPHLVSLRSKSFHSMSVFDLLKVSTHVRPHNWLTGPLQYDHLQAM
ncbi:unnamed protein product [Mesocestoides corti]|uniref:Ovule protein n=1 Tax=Mesocestoides corti TaxID=53468 RepID=A0A0R3U2K7_MESCO|nr:unnamed protein product [Mesocestoides corti]